jgi:CheY-like chemotaxis protein
MPGTDGHELMRRVRALGDDEGGRTPSVALTAYAGDADRARALRAGYHAYLTKPVVPDTLVSTLANLVGRAASREAWGSEA